MNEDLKQRIKNNKSSVISIAIKDKQALYMSYMPYIQNGGLFVPGNKPFKLGDEVFLMLQVMNEPKKFLVAGKVIWITPLGSQGNMQEGFGVQFTGDDADQIRNVIETNLGSSIQSKRPTHTM